MRNKLIKIIWTLTFIQVLLSILAISKDAKTLYDFFGLILLCSGGAVLLATLSSLKNIRGEIHSALVGAHLLTSTLAISLLSFISYTTLTGGPLEESGLIFVVFPTGYIKYSVVGAALGIIIHMTIQYLSNKCFNKDNLSNGQKPPIE